MHTTSNLPALTSASRDVSVLVGSPQVFHEATFVFAPIFIPLDLAALLAVDLDLCCGARHAGAGVAGAPVRAGRTGTAGAAGVRVGVGVVVVVDDVVVLLGDGGAGGAFAFAAWAAAVRLRCGALCGGDWGACVAAGSGAIVDFAGLIAWRWWWHGRPARVLRMHDRPCLVGLPHIPVTAAEAAMGALAPILVAAVHEGEVRTASRFLQGCLHEVIDRCSSGLEAQRVERLQDVGWERAAAVIVGSWGVQVAGPCRCWRGDPDVQDGVALRPPSGRALQLTRGASRFLAVDACKMRLVACTGEAVERVGQLTQRRDVVPTARSDRLAVGALAVRGRHA